MNVIELEEVLGLPEHDVFFDANLEIAGTKYYEYLGRDFPEDSPQFEVSIKWDFEKIANSEKPNGYLIQLVHCSCCPSVSSVPPATYFEYWKAEEGIARYKSLSTDCDYDDRISTKCPFTLPSVIGECMGRSGTIQFDGFVYWVPDKETEVINQLKGWERGGARYALELPSVEFNCKDIKQLQFAKSLSNYFLFQRVVKHSYDFSDSSKWSELIQNNILNTADEYERLINLFDSLSQSESIGTEELAKLILLKCKPVNQSIIRYLINNSRTTTRDLNAHIKSEGI